MEFIRSSKNKQNSENMIIIAVLVLFMLYYFLRKRPIKFWGCGSGSEHMGNTTVSKFNETFGKGDKINLKCKINNVDYYLTNVPISQMSKTEGTSKTDGIDCSMSAMILVPASEIDKKLKAYMNKLQSNSKICNSTAQIKCEEQLKNAAGGNTVSGDALSKCAKVYPKCSRSRFFVHDFIINKEREVNGANMYTFKGVTKPSENNSLIPSIINQHLTYDKAAPMLCSDKYPYGSSRFPKEYGEIIVEEEHEQTGGVIGNDRPIKIKLAFRTRKITINVDKKGIKKYIPTEEFIKTYVGICDNAKLKPFKTSSGEYQRVCLIPESKIGETGTQVLKFTPSTV